MSTSRDRPPDYRCQATPLTFERLFEVVKGLPSGWFGLGAGLGLYDRLEIIRRRHNSDAEACLKAAIEAFLRGEGHYQPSWRRVIHALYSVGETRIAQDIISYAEPVEDPTLTVDDVTKVINKIEGDKVEVMGWRGLGIPESLLKEIEKRYSTDSEKSYAYADYYVHAHPDASWEDLTTGLWSLGELTAAKISKSFMSTDPTLTVENMTGVMAKVEPKEREQVYGILIITSILEKIQEQCSEREVVYVDAYVNCRPSSSWQQLAKVLYQLHHVAAVEDVKSYLPPRDLTITTDKLMELFASEDPEKVDGLGGGWLELPTGEVDKIKKNYQSPTQRKEAYLDMYVHQHPCPSWQRVAEVLRHGFRLDQQADFVEKTYVKVSEKTQQSFDAAMMEGEVSMLNGSVLLVGSGGSGKTHVLASILEEAAPVMRESTPCAKAPVRTVAHCKAEVSDDHFVRIDDDQYSDMLIATTEHLPQPTTEITTKSEEQKQIKKSVDSHSSTEKKTSEPDLPLAKVDAVQSKHSWCVRRAMKKEYLGRMQAGRLKKKSSLNNKEIVDFRDTGGQSMFHETLPVFIHNTMFGMVTVKLNERLDSYPKIEYYIKGERVGEPFDSTFTHQETFRHCMRVIRSTCDVHTTPKIAFVGTHKDLEKECPKEDRKMKEEKLRSIIPPAMEDSIVTFGESLLLAVNAKTPGEDDKIAMAALRRKIMEELRKLKPSRIPLRYVPLEMAFRRLAKDQGKSVLNKEECFQIALTYNFTRESFEAALKYLHGLKLIFYYEEVLPDLVFIDAQALLDKITELVVRCLELHTKSGVRFLGALKKFVKCGIVTMEILSEFESHYVPSVFTRKELVKLFKYLRIVAEVGNGEYLMPCLLKKVEGLPRLMPGMSSVVVPALLFYFGRDGPLLGVYCFLLSSLIADAGWKLLEKGNYPVQVCRNQAKFILPGKNPGAVTITDSFSTFFHVAIEPGEDASAEEALEVYKEVCPTIRETILTAIRKASRKLNYSNSIPEIAFPCMCVNHEGLPLHPATISSTGLLTCTEDPLHSSRMTELHYLWKVSLELAHKSSTAGPVVSPATSMPPATQSDAFATRQDGRTSSCTGSQQPMNTGSSLSHPPSPKRQCTRSEPSSQCIMANLTAAKPGATIQSTSPQAMELQQPKITAFLSINDLGVVLEAVWEARSKWYNIGLKLGTSPGTLDSISLKGSGDPDLCITPMIKDWLNNGNPRPTWAAIAKALKSPMVGYGHLAEQLTPHTT